MVVGPNKIGDPSPMILNAASVHWVEKFKYLGITLLAGAKFTVDLSPVRRSFFIAANAILNKSKSTSDLVKFELIEKHCLPILLYTSKF